MPSVPMEMELKLAEISGFRSDEGRKSELEAENQELQSELVIASKLLKEHQEEASDLRAENARVQYEMERTKAVADELTAELACERQAVQFAALKEQLHETMGAESQAAVAQAEAEKEQLLADIHAMQAVDQLKEQALRELTAEKERLVAELDGHKKMLGEAASERERLQV